MRKLAAIVALITGLTMTGCAVPTEVSEGAAGPSASQAGKPGKGDHVTKVGTWAKASDGIAFRVSKLKRSRVPSISAGGHPGDPAAIITVQMRNSSKHRFDMTLVDVQVRFGKDGEQAEQVFADHYGAGFGSGTLAPGRTATARFMFAASSKADLKKVSVEIAPGLDYESFTFEGSA